MTVINKQSDILLIGTENEYQNKQTIKYLTERHDCIDILIYGDVEGYLTVKSIVNVHSIEIRSSYKVFKEKVNQFNLDNYKQIYLSHFNYFKNKNSLLVLRLSNLPSSIKIFYLYRSQHLLEAINPFLFHKTYSELLTSKTYFQEKKWFLTLTFWIKLKGLVLKMISVFKIIIGTFPFLLYWLINWCYYFKNIFKKIKTLDKEDEKTFDLFINNRYMKNPQNAASKTNEVNLFRKVKIIKPSLELGAGDGIFSSIMLKEGRIDVGSDYVPGIINKAKKLNNYNEFMVVDATNMQFPDEHFSTIIFVHGIDHIDNKESVFKEAGRILKKGGIFAFSDVSEEWDKSYLSNALKKIRLIKLSEKYQAYNRNASLIAKITSFSQYKKTLPKYGFKILEISYFDHASLHKLRGLMRFFTLELKPITRFWFNVLNKVLTKFNCLKRLYIKFMKRIYLPYIENDKDCNSQGGGGNLFIVVQKVD